MHGYLCPNNRVTMGNGTHIGEALNNNLAIKTINRTSINNSSNPSINKVVQNIHIYNVPTLSITPMPSDEIKLRSGRIAEPIIEDAPSSESDKESGEKTFADTEKID